MRVYYWFIIGFYSCDDNTITLPEELVETNDNLGDLRAVTVHSNIEYDWEDNSTVSII